MAIEGHILRVDGSSEGDTAMEPVLFPIKVGGQTQLVTITKRYGPVPRIEVRGNGGDLIWSADVPQLRNYAIKTLYVDRATSDGRMYVTCACFEVDNPANRGMHWRGFKTDYAMARPITTEEWAAGVRS